MEEEHESGDAQKRRKPSFKISMKNTVVVKTVFAVMQSAIESQYSKGIKQSLGSCTSNKLKVLLNTGLDGDIGFPKIQKT